ncbi:MAG TPA: CHAT domain-containing protein, partial [Geminicoccaceae bacterium]|nr:CHAT domain-containing protein [Geminicoccaceae bacterium]
SLVLSPNGTVDGDEGLAEASGVMSWDLRAGLAVLSHAEPIQPRPTGEALTALSWSFLAAGTPTLASSRWAPEGTATPRTDPLVRGFYRELLRPLRQGEERPSPAVALQRAARRLVAAPATRHPWHWARMMVVGY